MSLHLRRRRPETLCRCGHARSAHEHLRPGTDCALGERDHCTHFSAAPAHRSATVLRRLRHGRGEVAPGTVAPVVRIPDPAAPGTSEPQPSPRRRTSA